MLVLEENRRPPSFELEKTSGTGYMITPSTKPVELGSVSKNVGVHRAESAMRLLGEKTEKISVLLSSLSRTTSSSAGVGTACYPCYKQLKVRLREKVHLNISDIELQYLSSAPYYGSDAGMRASKITMHEFLDVCSSLCA